MAMTLERMLNSKIPSSRLVCRVCWCQLMTACQLLWDRDLHEAEQSSQPNYCEFCSNLDSRNFSFKHIERPKEKETCYLFCMQACFCNSGITINRLSCCKNFQVPQTCGFPLTPGRKLRSAFFQGNEQWQWPFECLSSLCCTFLFSLCLTSKTGNGKESFKDCFTGNERSGNTHSWQMSVLYVFLVLWKM